MESYFSKDALCNKFAQELNKIASRNTDTDTDMAQETGIQPSTRSMCINSNLSLRRVIIDDPVSPHFLAKLMGSTQIPVLKPVTGRNAVSELDDLGDFVLLSHQESGESLLRGSEASEESEESEESEASMYASDEEQDVRELQSGVRVAGRSEVSEVGATVTDQIDIVSQPYLVLDSAALDLEQDMLEKVETESATSTDVLTALIGDDSSRIAEVLLRDGADDVADDVATSASLASDLAAGVQTSGRLSAVQLALGVPGLAPPHMVAADAQVVECEVESTSSFEAIALGTFVDCH